jgi:hypothetical protein
MDYNPWQPGAKVRVKSTNQDGIIISRDEGQSTRVQFTPNPDVPTETVTTVVANDDLDYIPQAGEVRPLGFDTSGGLDVVAKLEGPSAARPAGEPKS